MFQVKVLVVSFKICGCFSMYLQACICLRPCGGQGRGKWCILIRYTFLLLPFWLQPVNVPVHQWDFSQQSASVSPIAFPLSLTLQSKMFCLKMRTVNIWECPIVVSLFFTLRDSSSDKLFLLCTWCIFMWVYTCFESNLQNEGISILAVLPEQNVSFLVQVPRICVHTMPHF